MTQTCFEAHPLSHLLPGSQFSVTSQLQFSNPTAAQRLCCAGELADQNEKCLLSAGTWPFSKAVFRRVDIWFAEKKKSERLSVYLSESYQQ